MEGPLRLAFYEGLASYPPLVCFSDETHSCEWLSFNVDDTLPLTDLGFFLGLSRSERAPVGSMTDWLVQGPALPEPNTRDDGDDVH